MGDVLSEVYRFARARVIVTGFLVQILASVVFAIVVALPPDPDYMDQAVSRGGGRGSPLRGLHAWFSVRGQLLNSYVLRPSRTAGVKSTCGPDSSDQRWWVKPDTVVFCAVAWGGLILAGDMPL